MLQWTLELTVLILSEAYILAKKFDDKQMNQKFMCYVKSNKYYVKSQTVNKAEDVKLP